MRRATAKTDESLEAAIERSTVEELEALDIWTLKHGKQGWPDRQVFIAPRHHVWFEFKRALSGRLTRAQKLRIPWLEERGERVYIITSTMQAVSIAIHEKEWICAST